MQVLVGDFPVCWIISTVEFCVSLVFLLAFFLINVVLAVLVDNIHSDELEDKNEVTKKLAISKSILRALDQGRDTIPPNYQVITRIPP